VIESLFALKHVVVVVCTGKKSYVSLIVVIKVFDGGDSRCVPIV